MEISMDFVKRVYVGEEALENEKLFKEFAWKIFCIMKQGHKYKSYLLYLDENSKRLMRGPVEELHFEKLSEEDIIRAIVTKEVLDNSRPVGIFKVTEIFYELLMMGAIEVYPISNVNHQILHNTLYGDKSKNAEDILKDLGVIPYGDNTIFIKEYMEYLPQSILDQFDVPDTRTKIKTILTIKNEAGDILFEGPNELRGVENEDGMFTAVINISGEDCSKYFRSGNSTIGLYSDDMIKIMKTNEGYNPESHGIKNGDLKDFHIGKPSNLIDEIVIPRLGSLSSDPGLSGCILPNMKEPFLNASEGRKAMIISKMKQAEETKPLEFKTVYEKYKYVHDALNVYRKSISEVAKELCVSETRIREMYDAYITSTNMREYYKDLYEIFGEETRIIKSLARGGIDAHKLRDMYMKDSSLEKLREIKGIGATTLKKILKAMK